MTSPGFFYPTGLEGLAYPQDPGTPATYSQDPAERLDYSIDWTAFLPTGDVIVGSAWTADTGLGIDQFAATDTTTTVWVSGGVAGFLYHVTNTITTAGGRVIDRTLRFKIKHQG